MASRRGAGVPLSRREWEIAALVEEGLSDREIAERLFLSRRTVEGHLQQVRNKLGFSNRAQISSWVTGRKREPEPVARSAARPPDNLPPQFTTFIGRERDLGGVRQLLRRARVVTITGAGGSGKTRLALQVASEVVLQYPAGVWFFALDSVSDPDAIPRQVGAVVGRLRSSQPVLVLLDNCEHLAASCAATVDALLRSRPNLAFLCTSREPLHLSAEAIWKMGSLSLPPARRHETPDSLVRSEAVRLFLDRACLHDAELTLDGTNAADIANLCRQLDGMPLALELAAARVGLMPLCQIVDHLGSRLTAFRQRDVTGRHESVTAAIDWSYELLSDLERAVLCRLSVLRGSFTRDAADALCHDLAGPSGPSPLDVLTLLADRSLVQAIPPRRERYRCLELVRRYASERLRESGELELIADRHHDHYFEIAERAAPQLTGPDQAEWLQRLADDHDNLRAALEVGRDRPPGHRMRFVLALQRYWRVRGHVAEGRAWVEHALTDETQAPTRLRAQTLSVAAGLTWQQGDLTSARTWQERCLAAWQDLGDRAGIQYSTGNLGVIAWQQGDITAARRWYEESLSLARALGNEREAAVVLCNLGLLLVYEGEAGPGEGHLREALAIMRALGDVAAVATVLADLGTAALEGSRDDEAFELFVESLRIQSYLGARESLASCVEGLASIAGRRARPDRAMLLAGAAEVIRQTVGPASQPSSERIFRASMEGARSALGEDAERVRAQGRELSAEEAIALALAE